MKLSRSHLLCLMAFFAAAILSCGPPLQRKKAQPPSLTGAINQKSIKTFDSLLIESFFIDHPKLQQYSDEVKQIYRKHKFHYIWFDRKGVLEFAHALYGKMKLIEDEGIYTQFPYLQQLEPLFEQSANKALSEPQTELMISCMFLFYSEKVYSGFDHQTAAATEWLLPKKQISYENLLDSLLLNPEFLNQPGTEIFSQYYKLREKLKRYRQIEEDGGWKPIGWNPNIKTYEPNDTSATILAVKKRLWISGELSRGDSSNRFDEALAAAIEKFMRSTGKIQQPQINQSLIYELNIPVEERIKKIVVNMERCRWMEPAGERGKAYIFINIPSYMLYFVRNGEVVLESPVVVGKTMNKTIVFSANMSSIVFSPYWNIPESIIRNEINPGIKKDSNYLAKHNMEWHNGQLRQKPGRKNSLGLVKFVFPNTNSIYLHDTPLKSHFGRNERAFSHGCIRVAKPRELAVKILENDSLWSAEKIDAAMNGGVEKWYSLKEKIPVYIAYFTSWVDNNGQLCFYNDIYQRDSTLFEIITGNTPNQPTYPAVNQQSRTTQQ